MAFDVITPVQMGRGEIAVSPSLTTFRTTPVDSVDLVKTIDLANNSAAEVAVSVYLVPTGSIPSNANILFPAVLIPASSMVQWSGVQILNEGDTVQAKASVAGVSLHVSGGNAV